MTVDAWRGDELPAVVALLDEASAFQHFPLDQVAENLADDLDAVAELRLCIRGGSRLLAAAVGTTRGQVGYVKLLAVAPDQRRRGLGSALLAELERRLAARGCTSLRLFADAPHYLRPGVEYRDTAFISFCERCGFEQRRAVCNMTADLRTAHLDTAADEARLAINGFTVRRLAAADGPAFETYLRERWTENWRVEGLRSLRRDPVSTHLCLREDSIVGFATHSVSGPGQFGPMGTDAELRGKGVGALLLRRCLADQKAAGFAECDIQWVGPKGFYADHVSAVISRGFWQYEKPLGASAL